MAEGNYGRLFTFEDVCTIVGLAQYGETGEQVVAEAERLGMLTFPADEPLFLLRGQDHLASDTVSFYVRKALFYFERVAAVAGIPGRITDEFAGAVSAAYQEFYRWQIANPDRVKVPD